MGANPWTTERAFSVGALALLAATAGGCGGGSSSPSGGGNASSGAHGDASDDGSSGVGSGDGASAAAVDCTTATTYCVAADVVRNGTPLHCATMTAASGDVSRLTSGTPTWSIGCNDQANELSVVVDFPVQAPGTFAFTAPASASPITFSVTAFDLAEGSTIGTMSESSTNLVAGMLSGSVTAGPTGIGKLTASWGAPDASCTSGDPGNPCDSGSVTLTFHVPLP